MERVKGVYNHQGKFVVKKYGMYIGYRATIEEANKLALDADIERGLLNVKSITPSGVKTDSR